MGADILINGEPISDYGGAALLDYSIGGTEINNTVFQGINRTHWARLKSTFGRRDIEITIIFKGRNLEEAKLNRSRINAFVWSECELFIPAENYYYTCICTDLGEEELVGIGEGIAKIKASYKFSGIRHGEPAAVEIPAGGSVYCESTAPFTDCRLTATASSSANTYQLGGATFTDVVSGQVLVFDGITGAVTKGGANAGASTSWTKFPALVPGDNTIQSADPVLVEYTPVYI